MDRVIDIASLFPLGTVLIVPGYVLLSIESKIAPCVHLRAFERTCRYFIYSFLFFACAGLIFGGSVFQASWGTLAGAISLGKYSLICLLVLMPVAVIFGLNRRFDWLGQLLRVIRIPSVDSVDTGWERAFLRREGCLVRLTFRDGTDRFGMLGNKSLVGILPGKEDVYLEETYCENADGLLEPEVGSTGLWVNKNELACIRLYRTEDLETDEAKEKCQPTGWKCEQIKNGSSSIAFEAGADSCRGLRAEAITASAKAVGTNRESEEPVEVSVHANGVKAIAQEKR